MSDPLLVGSVDALFAGLCEPGAVESAERDGWAGGMWDHVAELGLPWISVPEDRGGEGGELTDALAVLRLAGRHALPLPLAETGVLAGWLVAAASLPVRRIPATVASAAGLRLDAGRLTGTARNVPWGHAVQQVVVLIDGQVLTFGSASRVERHRNLAGEPSDTLHFDSAVPDAAAPVPPHVDAELLRLRGALTRVVMMAGALQRMLEITVRYVGERQQFGRPVGRFQAVQQHVVHLGQQAALLDMAAAHAGAAVAGDDDREYTRMAVSSAKVVADRAATIATAAAHQAHGAMGMTREYPLHLASRRLWAWTRQWGTGASVAIELGRVARSSDPDELWSRLSR